MREKDLARQIIRPLDLLLELKFLAGGTLKWRGVWVKLRVVHLGKVVGWSAVFFISIEITE